MTKNYIKKIYAGWLSKIIGIRLGAPIENTSLYIFTLCKPTNRPFSIVLESVEKAETAYKI